MRRRRRNNLCWCGSGEKYKDCHSGREAESPIPLSDVLRVQKKIWTKQYCSHPQQSSCSGNIVQAHTIQKKGSLEKISRKGHVYTFKTDIPGIMKTGLPQINFVGINKASTFTGFCSHHDNDVFRPIEKDIFPVNEETGFLLAYRVLCHELFLKKASIELLHYAKENYDKGKSLAQQVRAQGIANQFLLGLESAADELTKIKTRYDEALTKQDYKDVRYYAILLEDTPTFVCSGFTQPVYDFNGTELQDLADLDIFAENFAFSIITTNFGGAIIYSWIDENISSVRFIKSLINLTPQEQINSSARFAFENFENLYMSPNWWETLTPELKKNLSRRQLSGTPDYPHTGSNLLDDGVELISWKISKIETNLSAQDLQDL